jgi:hypothetical protein
MAENEADEQALLDQVAMEAMNAIENKDKAAFREAFEVFVVSVIHKLTEPETEEE